ncbi:MAG: ABC transporter substrate-binding protein [Planctomycetes bacterium]|nr:ABC transporter substrate-binding protein [Planctomycetota bacterium]
MTVDPHPVLRLGHSPDPDDAFMWWPLLAREEGPSAVDTGRFRFEIVAEDIETLNLRSDAADLEITAMSCAQYPRVQDRYAITACGASMGDGYGPKLVAPEAVTVEDLRSGTVVLAVPGERTSAFGCVSLLLGPGSFDYRVVPFEQIIPRVAAGEFGAGLVIHEGQLTFAESGLRLLEDLGAWWSRREDLPLPLGVNAIRRDLATVYGQGALGEITAILRRSVEHALANRDESIRYALEFARGMDRDLADRFVSMYVNRWTLDFGDTGRRAVHRFLSALSEAGLAPPSAEVDFVAAAR